MNSNSFEVKKTLESDLSGPRGSAVAKGYGGTGPAFRPIHVASVTVFPNHRVFFQTFQAEPMALTWPIGPGMLERHQLHRRVSRADVIPCSLSQIPSGFAGLQGEFILAFSLEEASTFGRGSSRLGDSLFPRNLQVTPCHLSQPPKTAENFNAGALFPPRVSFQSKNMP
jgi:hypothetical protein